MKVVHVSTIDSGGAANAAYRLHEGLLKSGVQSSFLVLHHDAKDNNVIKFQTPVSDQVSFFFRKLKSRLRNRKFSKTLREVSSQIEIFTSPLTIYDICKHSLVKDADVIHLHWVANFIDFPTFFRHNKKPVVWTFHDENPLHGGIHYQDDQSKLSPALALVESVFADIKKKAFTNAKSSIWPICPSPWLLRQVGKSDLAKIFQPATCIYYGIDSNKFRHIEQLSARAAFGLPHDKRLILLACSNLNVYRKGFDLFYEANKKVTQHDNVEFIVVGNSTHLPDLRFVRVMGFINDPSKLMTLYNAVDATLIPSREDNLPNVMLESLVSGTPVLAFKIGGIADIVEQDFNGMLAAEVSADALYGLLKRYLSRPSTFNRYAIRSKAAVDFDNKVQVQKVTNIYRKCIQ
jgi:glycosyltransferase involved in cell wall biosynthesis